MINSLLQRNNSTLPGILMLGILLSIFTSCHNNTKEIKDLVDKATMQEDKAYGVTILYSENGKVKVRLYANEFVRNELAKPPYVDMKKGLKMEAFNDSGTVESTLTARYARYYEKQQNILIRDSIVVINKKGERLDTEELVWNQKLQKLYTEKFVRITTPTQVMYGDGLEANQDFTWYKIKNIKGIMSVDKKEVPGG